MVGAQVRREQARYANLKWVVSEKIESALIDPGRAWQNGTNESLNGKFRDECVAMEWFRNRIEAKVVIDDWRRHDNEVRPHSSLNLDTPLAYRRRLENNSTTAVIAGTEWSQETGQVIGI